MLFKRKNGISSRKLLENSRSRLVEIEKLIDSRNQLPKPVVTFIRNELIRCRTDVHAVKCINKEILLDTLHEIELTMFHIEYRLEMYDQTYCHDTLLSGFYPELQKNIKDSSSIEIFAGFEKMNPSDEAELPGLSYGVKLFFKSGEERIHIFNSSGDGCMMSDMANERRKRTLNVVTAVVSDILHAINPREQKLSCLSISIRTDIEIVGFDVPSGWNVQQPPVTFPELYQGN